MGTKTALQVLYRLTTDDLLQRVPGVQVHFGWRPPNRQQTTTQRIVWTPGDESGSLGKELGATKVGISVSSDPNQRPTSRNLVDLDELWHVQIQAFDPTATADEFSQYNVCRLLYDSWRASVYRACHGTTRVGQVRIESARWSVDNIGSEFRHGASIIATGSIRSPIPDDTVGFSSPTQVLVSTSLDNTPTNQILVPVSPS
jgi:hypothetical protein